MQISRSDHLCAKQHSTQSSGCTTLLQGEDQEAVAAELLQRQFTMDEIAQEIFVKGALFGVIESLCREFVHVEVIEHYGSYMRLRLERHNHSIGFLFKLVEELKEEH